MCGQGRGDVCVWVGKGRRGEMCVWWNGEGVVCASAACDLRYMVMNCRGFSSQFPHVCPYSRFTPRGVGFQLLKLNCGSVPNESSTRNKHLKDVNGYNHQAMLTMQHAKRKTKCQLKYKYGCSNKFATRKTKM